MELHCAESGGVTIGALVYVPHICSILFTDEVTFEKSVAVRSIGSLAGGVMMAVPHSQSS